MDKSIQISVRNSELAIPKDKRAFLTYPADGLAVCALEELEDGVCFYFETEGLEQSKEVFSKSKEQQLRFLINCAGLIKLYNEYEFSLSTENMLVDINLLPKILLRDARNGNGVGDIKNNIGNDNDGNNTGIGNGNGFLPKYKALIGSFLLRKYKYEDFTKGGEDLYKKNKLLLELSKMENVYDIKDRLIKEYNKTVKEIQQTRLLVPKRNVLIFRVLIPLLTLALLAASFFAAMALLNDIPYRNQVILANQAYIAGNPLEVQRALADLPVHRLSHETRHILSRSYVATEPLSDAQRSNILMGLTLITDPSIFDYWIHLGRLEFYEAIDIALRFGDNELLLFAYIRQEAFVRADPHMPGSEKVVLLSDLESRIAALQRDREDAGGLVGGEGYEGDDSQQEGYGSVVEGEEYYLETNINNGDDNENGIDSINENND